MRDNKKLPQNQPKTQEAAIADFRRAHGDKYDYSLTVYEKGSKKIKIICPDHGVFEMVAQGHASGRGCRRGSCNNVVNKRSREEIVARFIKTHGNRFDYSRVVYVTGKTKVEIICPEHGPFYMQPDAHTLGQSCEIGSCNPKRDTKEQWVEKARKVHGDKYDYTDTVYTKSTSKVTIKCDVHGAFTVGAQHHLYNGCRRCASGKISKKSLFWLKDELGLRDDQIEHPIICSGKKMYVDGFDAETKTIYEFYGRYWHADPSVYEDDDMIRDMRAADIWKRDEDKRRILKEHGYKVVVEWEK